MTRVKTMLAVAFLYVSQSAVAQVVTDRYDDSFRKYAKRGLRRGLRLAGFQSQGMAESDE